MRERSEPWIRRTLQGAAAGFAFGGVVATLLILVSSGGNGRVKLRGMPDAPTLSVAMGIVLGWTLCVGLLGFLRAWFRRPLVTVLGTGLAFSLAAAGQGAGRWIAGESDSMTALVVSAAVGMLLGFIFGGASLFQDRRRRARKCLRS